MTYEALPPYRAMLAVDMRDFSSNRGRNHARLTEQIPQILDAAFTRAGDGNLWAERKRFPRSDGDGYVAGFQPDVLPFLINPFLNALQVELEHWNRTDAVVPGQPIRMRVSLNVGPVTDSGEEVISGGSGAARVETHRLLEASALKEALDRSGDQTYVAAILSARAFEDAVATGYAGLDETHFARVTVQVKTYRATAFLRVPNPTGDLLRTGLAPDPNGANRGRPDVKQEDTRQTIGTVIGTSGGPVHSGTGNQYNNSTSRPPKVRRDRF